MNIEIDATSVDRPSSLPHVPGLLHGVRSWDLITEGSNLVDCSGEGEWLGAISHNLIWPRESGLAATCMLEEDHSVPDPECSCGIYALHPFAADYRQEMEDCEEMGQAFGVIAAGGRTEVHADGFRAEYAEPVALIVDRRLTRKVRERVARAALAYDVELISLDGPEDFEHYWREELHALNPETVDLLLSRGREVRVEPHACGFLTRRGRALGGFGYLPVGEEREPSMWEAESALEERGVRLLRVAGASYRPHALQSGAFAPGRRLRLLPEPVNLQDRSAIGIWDARLRLRVGYVPRKLAPEVGRRLRTGSISRVVSAWEWRDLREGRRIGLHVLISSTSNLTIDDPTQYALIEDADIPF